MAQRAHAHRVQVHAVQLSIIEHLDFIRALLKKAWASGERNVHVHADEWHTGMRAGCNAPCSKAPPEKSAAARRAVREKRTGRRAHQVPVKN
jgi:hypothetical protein